MLDDDPTLQCECKHDDKSLSQINKIKLPSDKMEIMNDLKIHQAGDSESYGMACFRSAVLCDNKTWSSLRENRFMNHLLTVSTSSR